MIQCLLGNRLLCPGIGCGAGRCVSTALRVAGMGYLGAFWDICDLPTDTAKVVCSQQHLPGQVFPVQVTFSHERRVLSCCLCPSWPLLQKQPQQQPDPCREPVLGEKNKQKKGWPVVDPCSLWESAASSPDRASASICLCQSGASACGSENS